VDPDSLNPDPENLVNPDPDPGLKKLFKIKFSKLNINGLFKIKKF